jgi:hypothetical protein
VCTGLVAVGGHDAAVVLADAAAAEREVFDVGALAVLEAVANKVLGHVGLDRCGVEDGVGDVPPAGIEHLGVRVGSVRYQVGHHQRRGVALYHKRQHHRFGRQFVCKLHVDHGQERRTLVWPHFWKPVAVKMVLVPWYA